ncbi:LuxR C-terminal-related transcriptional regulator [Sphingomonas sp. KR3-1]|uniref:response regulator transcription factor n=1 Tax=Sphingomonas sp. KR3-1 TaxID=3156611 RepID=UPI0032B5B3C3
MTATLASYDSRRADSVLFLGSAGVPVVRMRARHRLDPAARQPQAVVHIVHTDDAAAEHLAALCRATGIEAQLHASIQAFAEAELPDAPACLLLQLRSASVSAFEALAQRVAPVARPPMIVVAERAEVRTAVQAMKAGAIEFFDRVPRDQDLLDAIGTAIGMDRARRWLAVDCAALRAAFALLTDRERQVMARVTQGLLNKQVAGELGITEITVKAHRGAVMRKMGARTLADLVRMADALAYLNGAQN